MLLCIACVAPVQLRRKEQELMSGALGRERAQTEALASQLDAVNESYSACTQQLGAAREELRRTQQRLEETDVRTLLALCLLRSALCPLSPDSTSSTSALVPVGGLPPVNTRPPEHSSAWTCVLATFRRENE